MICCALKRVNGLSRQYVNRFSDYYRIDLDEVDRTILHELQEGVRNTTAEEMGNIITITSQIAQHKPLKIPSWLSSHRLSCAFVHNHEIGEVGASQIGRPVRPMVDDVVVSIYCSRCDTQECFNGFVSTETPDSLFSEPVSCERPAFSDTSAW